MTFPPMSTFRRDLALAVGLTVALASCASDDGAGPTRRASGFGSAPLPSGSAGRDAVAAPGRTAPAMDTGADRMGRQAERDAAAGGSGYSGSGYSDGTPGVSNAQDKPAGTVDWAPVYDSGAGSDQRVVYIDRANVTPEKLDNLTYYTARTREVRGAMARPLIQEIAVICEGTPKAPATAVRGEGTEDGKGTLSIRSATTPLSLDQFTSMKGLRLDANNPTAFVVRAVCMIGPESKSRSTTRQ